MRIHSVDCYECKASYEYDLDVVEEAGLKAGRGRIIENPEDPQSYYVKCPGCGHFNRVQH